MPTYGCWTRRRAPSRARASKAYCLRKGIVQDLIDDLCNPGAILAQGHTIDTFFKCRNGIGDGNRESALTEECMIVFRVPDSHDIRFRQRKLCQRGRKASTFINADRQNHDSFFVVDHLERETEFPNG